MCLKVIGWQVHPEYPLVVLSNRDEFYARRSRPAAWWGQAVSLLGGRDDEAGGTWLGINRRGRLAMLTNVRAPSERNPHAPSRGLLVLSALQSAQSLPVWLNEQGRRAQIYNGFNLLLAEPLGSTAGRRSRPPRLLYSCNRLGTGPQALAPGIYGLSNAFLDTPWPKVTRAVAAFACQLAQKVDVAAMFRLMSDRTLARERDLPSTGVPLEWERALSAVQIRANGYGTRATTIVTVRRDGLVNFVERSFDTLAPERFVDRQFEFTIDGAGVDRERLESTPDDPAE
ncbi:MAG TPA: NRDE family protein [Burkholderiaceae bacterium]|nr:NRDE family protein [Burkholderiaceae bacterium]